jgi:hypothetical protein
MRIGKSLFATPLLFLFVAFLYPQTGQASCDVEPYDWWCPTDTSQTTSTPQDPFSFSPGFDLVICLDQTCANEKLGSAAATLPTPDVRIGSDLGCENNTTATLSGPAICAAAEDGQVNPDSVAACDVTVILPGVTCTKDEDGNETYEKFQSEKQDPGEVFDAGSKVLVYSNGLEGWPCPDKSGGFCVGNISFPIGTQYCSSFNGCVAKIYPQTGDGSSYTDLGAGQVLKGVEAQSYLTLRACKGAANGTSDSIVCLASGKPQTGGGEASVGILCPQVGWAGNRTNISQDGTNNGVDLFPDADCILKNVDPNSVYVNGVKTTGYQFQQQDSRIRFFVPESQVWDASCDSVGDTAHIVMTGLISVTQGTGTVKVPFYTNPSLDLLCN